MSQDSCCAPIRGTKSKLPHQHLVPEQKNIPQEWLDSLTSRGTPQQYKGEDLKYIGMPVAGICTGQVYLGGDGQLWHWDVFKAYGGGWDEPIDPRGYHYPDPFVQKSPMAQGFAIKTTQGNESQTRTLDRNGFEDVGFTGSYPIGSVDYSDSSSPVAVKLNAYSPFIPLNADESGIPVTIVEYEVSNTSKQSVQVDLFGWLENMVCRYDNEEGKGIHSNTLAVGDNFSSLTCSAENSENSDVSKLDGYGNMTLALLGDSANHYGSATINDAVSDNQKIAQIALNQLGSVNNNTEKREFGTPLVGSLGQQFTLEAGESATVKFAISWYFPNYCGGYVFHSTLEDLPNLDSIKRYYSTQFESSLSVIGYVVENYQRLSSITQLWVDTWYDSTLPIWLLDRIFSNVSTLATQTCHRFDDGRFYGWEGVDCCPGTCQHVWQYAQGVARVFPELERYVREEIDFGIAWRSDGSIEYRAEAGSGEGDGDTDVHMKSENDAEAFFAADGQMGTILRVYREHMMAPNADFLNKIWPKVRASIKFMESLDANKDGLLEQAQFHTLDTTWYGEIPWISSLYLATLAAGKAMAEAMGDNEFIDYCEDILSRGRDNFVKELFNGEYFVHKADPKHLETSMNMTEGCYIDQVFGQSCALQYGLERVIPKEETISALMSLWKYNFAVDVGPYRENFTDVAGGRWYAMPGEGGMLMCSWPKNDCNRSEYDQPIIGLDVTSEGYLKECMSGFEYQVAAHMLGEGLITESLALTKTIHDRYHPSKRNPYNEIECSDHYSRGMSSYGIFINACGFHYIGPEGKLSMCPLITPNDFRAPMITAEGWSTFVQQSTGDSQKVEIIQRHGVLELNQLTVLNLNNAATIKAVKSNEQVALNFSKSDDKLIIQFDESIQLEQDEILTLLLN